MAAARASSGCSRPADKGHLFDDEDGDVSRSLSDEDDRSLLHCLVTFSADDEPAPFGPRPPLTGLKPAQDERSQACSCGARRNIGGGRIVRPLRPWPRRSRSTAALLRSQPYDGATEWKFLRIRHHIVRLSHPVRSSCSRGLPQGDGHRPRPHLRTAPFLPASSSLIAPLAQSCAVVANSGQGHRLVASGTQPAGPAVLPIVLAAVTRSTPSPDTGLAGTQGLHLFFSGQLRGAQDRAVSPFEVAAIRVMPQPGLGSCGPAINVHRINHVPNVWMFHSARHGSTL